MKKTLAFLARGGLLALLLVAGQFAHAQTYTTTDATGATSTTPGLPTTGAGGNMPLNVILLASSAVLMTLGGMSVYKDASFRKTDDK
jgi:hypothetical protein